LRCRAPRRVLPAWGQLMFLLLTQLPPVCYSYIWRASLRAVGQGWSGGGGPRRAVEYRASTSPASHQPPPSMHPGVSAGRTRVGARREI
jgi:hypothetical protein